MVKTSAFLLLMTGLVAGGVAVQAAPHPLTALGGPLEATSPGDAIPVILLDRRGYTRVEYAPGVR